MSLFRKKTEEPEDIHYEGNAVLRMLSYMRPHVGTMAFCLVLVLAVNWGPWFINNLDFGLGPRSPGGVSSRKEGSASENGQWVMQNVLGASVEEFSADYGEDGTVTFRLPMGSSRTGPAMGRPAL